MKGRAQQSNRTSYSTNFNRKLYASLNRKDKKQYLGEIIYPFIYAREQTNAAKITGMLLEIDDEELINYSKNTDDLIRKIEEASNVLKMFNQWASEDNKISMDHNNDTSTQKIYDNQSINEEAKSYIKTDYTFDGLYFECIEKIGAFHRITNLKNAIKQKDKIKAGLCEKIL